MKTLLTIAALSFAAMIAAPDAEARGHRGPSRHYVNYHQSCHGPAWIETYIAYYDRCGHPVFRTRIVPVRRVAHRHHYRHHGPSRVRVSYGYGSCR